MIDVKALIDNYDAYQIASNKRGLSSILLDEIKEFYLLQNKLIQKLNTYQSQRNELSKKFSSASDKEALHQEITQIKDLIKKEEFYLTTIQEKLTVLLDGFPNIVDESVPIGKNPEDNVEKKRWGQIKKKDFTPLPHHELAENLGIIDIKRGVKIAGSRFYVLRKEGALLERALVNFFLDEALKIGCEEIIPPYIVNKQSMYGTGQLPKFESDMFKIENENFYLVPTAEVPLTNLYSDEILSLNDLPKKFIANTSCFRKEVGHYGKETKGIFRVHQFQKVEFVKYSLPENSNEELEKLTSFAESLLEKLDLPYRRMLLCAGDTGFSSLKTYDLEVFIPSSGEYKEISSCSNFGSFQARRSKIRYKNEKGKNIYIHTLNGSCLAVGRTMIAILENYQNKDGSVSIPPVLQPYMQHKTIITNVNKETNL